MCIESCREAGREVFPIGCRVLERLHRALFGREWQGKAFPSNMATKPLDWGRLHLDSTRPVAALELPRVVESPASIMIETHLEVVQVWYRRPWSLQRNASCCWTLPAEETPC